MIYLYTIIFYQPIFNFLIWLYNVIPGHDVGIAIFILTVVIRLILFPITASSLKSQKALQDIQPKIQALKQQYKNEKEKMAKAMMELYSKEKVNPLSSCLPLLLQLPIFIALYQVLGDGLQGKKMELLYSFVSRPETVNAITFGVVDLNKPYFIFAILAGLAQFWQSKMLIHTKPPKVPGAKDEAMMSMMNKQMLYFMPLMTVFIGASLPSGLTLYWLLTNLLTIAQQMFFFRKKNTAVGAVLPAEVVKTEQNGSENK